MTVFADAEVETLQVRHLGWAIDRVEDERSPLDGQFRARRAGYTAYAPDAAGLRRSIIEWETGTGPNGCG